MTVKFRRQQAILDLVSRERLSSQHEIRERLAALGVEATQSTISRDIEELGLAKIHDQGGLRYVTPGTLGADASENGRTGSTRQNLKRLLREYAVSLTPSANVLVVQTPPGAAHLLAEGLDRSGLERMAGTVAGDNTIMMVARDGISARELQQELETIMEES